MSLPLPPTSELVPPPPDSETARPTDAARSESLPSPAMTVTAGPPEFSIELNVTVLLPSPTSTVTPAEAGNVINGDELAKKVLKPLPELPSSANVTTSAPEP